MSIGPRCGIRLHLHHDVGALPSQIWKQWLDLRRTHEPCLEVVASSAYKRPDDLNPIPGVKALLWCVDTPPLDPHPARPTPQPPLLLGSLSKIFSLILDICHPPGSMSREAKGLNTLKRSPIHLASSSLADTHNQLRLHLHPPPTKAASTIPTAARGHGEDQGRQSSQR